MFFSAVVYSAHPLQRYEQASENISSLLEYFSQRAKVSSRFTSKVRANKTYQACLNIFHSERKYLRALLKDTRKQYISSLLEYFSQRAKVSSRFTSKIIQLWYMILKMCPLCAFLALGYLSNCKKCEKTENCNFLCGMFRKMYFLCTFVVGTPAWER